MDNPQGASVQGNKLYVGGIPYRSTEDDLKKAFGEAGTVVSASIISDRMTGRSRGFGFVEMSSEAEAQAAIDRWDGKEMDGRTLSVSFARPQGDRPPRRPRPCGLARVARAVRPEETLIRRRILST